QIMCARTVSDIVRRALSRTRVCPSSGFVQMTFGSDGMRQVVNGSHVAELSPQINELMRTMGSDLEQGLVPLWVYNDPDLYRLELERIFARNWMFVAHESEIPRKGNYV